MADHRLSAFDQASMTAHCIGCDARSDVIMHGSQVVCKTRERARQRAYRQSPRGKETKRASWLAAEARGADWLVRNRRARSWRKYGLTRVEFDELVRAAEGRCAICERVTAELRVDHCHETGLVRGLLCTACNVGLGHFADDVGRLRRAADYLGA